MKKCIVLFLVLSLFAFSENLYAKKNGSELIVQKIDGQYAIGELIAVKENSLLLLDSESGADVSVDIREIKLIEIVKKSKSLAWGGIGLISGAVIGSLIGYVEGDDPPGYGTWWGHRVWMDLSIMTAKDKALGYGFYIGLSGAILGGIIGALEGSDKIVQIEGKSETEIRKALYKLRKKARIRNFQ